MRPRPSVSLSRETGGRRLFSSFRGCPPQGTAAVQ